MLGSGSRGNAVLFEGGGRRLVVSGQVGLTPDGHLDNDPEEQMRQALANLAAIPFFHLGKLITDCNKEISDCFDSLSHNLRVFH